MKLLLDTHILLWAAGEPQKLPPKMLSLIESQDNQLFFSAASIWEIVIKKSLGRSDFQVDARVLRRALIDNDYQELAITSEHTLFVGDLAPIHKDPFDRILVAQSSIEGIGLLSVDQALLQYGGSVLLDD